MHSAVGKTSVSNSIFRQMPPASEPTGPPYSRLMGTMKRASVNFSGYFATETSHRLCDSDETVCMSHLRESSFAPSVRSGQSYDTSISASLFVLPVDSTYSAFWVLSLGRSTFGAGCITRSRKGSGTGRIFSELAITTIVPELKRKRTRPRSGISGSSESRTSPNRERTLRIRWKTL